MLKKVCKAATANANVEIIKTVSSGCFPSSASQWFGMRKLVEKENLNTHEAAEQKVLPEAEKRQVKRGFESKANIQRLHEKKYEENVNA